MLFRTLEKYFLIEMLQVFASFFRKGDFVGIYMAIKFSFFLFLLVGCSIFPVAKNYRYIAGQDDPLQLKWSFEVAYPVIFANGANRQLVKVFLKDHRDQDMDVQVKDIKVYSDVAVGDLRVLKDKQELFITFRPQVKSPDFNLRVAWKEEISPPIQIRTTLFPQKDKLRPIKSSFVTTVGIGRIYYSYSENFDPGLFEGFMVDNDGKNRIVSQEESARTFYFNYIEQARQNISLMVNDIPNSTISHTMHSHFMFFPRLILPLAKRENDKIEVTLPTGEPVTFSTDGEIIDGVFKEGPVDVGPDRFKRQYADLKYQGEGVILRANARGQSPQLGQFENTPIDLEYGLKFSKDVLIINGKTGERCRRPKEDFWPSADLNPIEFKFPTDEAFNSYLQKNCKFEIPKLPMPQRNKKNTYHSDVEDVWSKCGRSIEILSCLEGELERFKDSESFSFIEYELAGIRYEAYQREKNQSKELLEQELLRVKTIIKKDLSWINNFEALDVFESDCLNEMKVKFKNPFRFSDPLPSLGTDLQLICQKMKNDVDQIVKLQLERLKLALEADLSWLQSINDLKANCTQQSAVFLSSGESLKLKPEIFMNQINKICADIPSSSSYQDWLKSQRPQILENLINKILSQIESQGEVAVKSCLSSFPGSSNLDRLRFKEDREACLSKKWTEMENSIVSSATREKDARSMNIESRELLDGISTGSKRIKIRMIKKYF